MPIYAQKVPAKEGRVLVEKMTRKIKQWSTKNLSYAGRVILINALLVSIHSYWSQIMLLPKMMLNEIKKVCRAFLWKGKEAYEGPGAVAWNHLCKTKAAGGLGIRNFELWNRAAMFKHFWAVAKKKDNMWVKWIHHVYVKEGDIWGIKAHVDSSYRWKKLLELRDQFVSIGEWNKEYSIACGIENYWVSRGSKGGVTKSGIE